MKSRIITSIQTHPLPWMVGAVIVGVLVVYLGGGLLTGVRHYFEDRKVTSLEEQASESALEAAKESYERKAEDLNRERNIQPQLERSRRDVATARERTRKAEIDYENARKNAPDSGSADTRALHDRNCADLRELYPGESIPFCHD